MKAMALIMVALVFSGCKDIQIQEGRIPSEYIAAAAQYMGSYQGQFNRTPAEITLWLDGDIVKVKYSDARGSDILDPKCESQIGLLKSITVSGDEKNPNLEVANFAFDPGSCPNMVLGRMLILMFNKKSSAVRMQPAILQRWERCPWYECTNPDRDVYLRGELNKVN